MKARWLRHLALRLFSVAFAIALWVFVNLGERDAEKSLLVPLELRSVPAEFVVTSVVVPTIDVRVRGPRTLLGTIDPERHRIDLDLARIRPGRTTFRIDGESLALPRGVRVQRISPAQVSLDVEHLEERILPVTVDLADRVPPGLRLVEHKVEPGRARVLGPSSSIAMLTEVAADPPMLPAKAGEVAIDAPLVRPEGLTELEPDHVTLKLRLQAIEVERTFENVAVVVRGTSVTTRIAPAIARMTVRGPQRQLDLYEPAEGALWVEGAGLESGEHRANILGSLPEGFELLDVDPESVSVEVLAPVTAAPEAPPEP